MDPDAPWHVAQGTVLTSLATSLLASAYGTFKRQNPGPLALATAVNSGIAGATFFSFREYIISPLFVSTLSWPQYVRRSSEVGSAKGKQRNIGQQLSWSEMRMHNLPDTTVSGALTGAVLNAWKRGRAGIMPGATTASLVCAFLQLAYNEIGVFRVKYVSRKLEEAREKSGGMDTVTTAPQSSEIPVVHQLPAEERRPFAERFFEFLGMPKVSDEEYLQRMKVKRETYLRRIAELEAERARSQEAKPAAEGTHS